MKINLDVCELEDWEDSKGLNRTGNFQDRWVDCRTGRGRWFAHPTDPRSERTCLYYMGRGKCGIYNSLDPFPMDEFTQDFSDYPRDLNTPSQVGRATFCEVDVVF